MLTAMLPEPGDSADEYRVFICYRRSDAQDAAGRLALELMSRVPLNDKEVFVDTESLKVGEQWKQRIHDTIVQLDALIAVISPDWTKPEPDGKLRLRKPNDPVRVELETAMGNGIPVLPVLVGGAQMPEAKDLPTKLRGLPGLHAIELRHKQYKRDVEPLVDNLRAYARSRAQARRPVRRRMRGPLPMEEDEFGLRPIGAWATEDRDAWFAETNERIRLEAREKAERRRNLPAFYQRAAWWIAAVLTLAATFAAAIGSEFLLGWAAGLFGITQLSTAPAPVFVVYALVWGATYVAVATAFYANDPGRGARTFYTRGLFGGWTLALSDEEDGGLPAAFPLSMVVAWIGARLGALGLDLWLNVDQIGFFILILAIATIWAVAMYVLDSLGNL